MPAQVFEFDPPERFVVGTVGEPGSRTFYIQATGNLPNRPGKSVTSVALEKQQVSVLADRIDELLDEVSRQNVDLAPESARVISDVDPLELPLDEEFRVGTMSLGWDEDREVLVLECFATLESDFTGSDQEPGESDPPPGTDGDREVLRVMLTRAQAREFISRAEAVVEAGRPPCPFCEGPLDPAGHICPRANGYRR